MSAAPKLPGGKRAQGELARFKYFWRDHLTAADQEFWRSRFHSPDSQAALRAELKSRLHFDLKYDKQLTQFRKWDEEQQELDAEAERQAEEERRLRETHPDWDADRLRQEVIAASYRRSLASGDFKLGLKTVAADAKLKTIELDREKFEELRRKADQADQAKGVMENPELNEAQRVARMREVFGIK